MTLINGPRIIFISAHESRRPQYRANPPPRIEPKERSVSNSELFVRAYLLAFAAMPPLSIPSSGTQFMAQRRCTASVHEELWQIVVTRLMTKNKSIDCNPSVLWLSLGRDQFIILFASSFGGRREEKNFE